MLPAVFGVGVVLAFVGVALVAAAASEGKVVWEFWDTNQYDGGIDVQVTFGAYFTIIGIVVAGIAASV